MAALILILDVFCSSCGRGPRVVGCFPVITCIVNVMFGFFRIFVFPTISVAL